MTDLSTTPDLVTTDDGDHDRFTHIVPFAERLAEAIVNQTLVTAWCGKRWIPGRDPKRFPLCQTCKEIVVGLGREVPSE